ncbi:hypothetical protein K8I85_16070 [bacterium]|nr:hypothetical protein [bacterium]
MRCLGSALLAACAGLAPAAAQNLPLPTLPVSLTTSSRTATVTWSEAPIVDGRALSNIDLSAAGDSASAITFVGLYALDCDYRLRLSKVPKEAGFNRHIELVYEIADNITGVGLPLRTDTLDVYFADTDYFFNPSIAGNLGVRFAPTSNQPATTLGTITMTIDGLSTSSSANQNYFATALNSVTMLSDTLRVQVTGPVPFPVPNPLPNGTRTITLNVTQAGVQAGIQNGLFASFSEGQAAPGDSVFWSSRYLFDPGGVIRADLESFEGYHVWRADLPDVDTDWTLLGEILQCDSKEEILLVDEAEALSTGLDLTYDPLARMFTLVDSDIHNDFPYRYAVSAFDRGFLGNPEDATFEGILATTEKVYPAPDGRNPDAGVYVVPNPYNERAAFEEGGPRVIFANLPTRCSIRIYTVATDYVVTLTHGPGRSGSTSPTSRQWDLRSEAGLTVAPGVYVFYVDGTDDGVPGSVQQYGKFVIAR